MGTNAPEGGQQCALYYGAYANAFRGRQQKREAEEPIPTVLELEEEDFSQVPPAYWEYRITTPFASIWPNACDPTPTG